MNVHFSSKKHDWATPWPLFRELDARLGPFDLDVCATARNAKCGKFFSPEDDGLSQVWHGVCWMNPPYGRELPHWMSKAVIEVRANRARRVVCRFPPGRIRGGGTNTFSVTQPKSTTCAGESVLKEPVFPRHFQASWFSLKSDRQRELFIR